MDNVIITDQQRKELREEIFTSYDIEVGAEDNSFEITVKRQEYISVPPWSYCYIPDTEYGGPVRRWETNTKTGMVMFGGLTWRGMMAHKIIQPPTGQDYATDSGELNAIIKRRIEEAFPFSATDPGSAPIIGTKESTGVTTSYAYRYTRYCTLLDGLESLLALYGYRLEIKYDQIQRAAVVSAVPIVDYSNDVEFSNDMQVNFRARRVYDGVNHLICLGEGELRNRTVVHLWTDGQGDGEIYDPDHWAYTSGDQTEVAEVYDYAGAARNDLITAGVQRLKETAELSQYEITIEGNMDIGIGDIVGGRDYLSGLYLKAPVAGKIVRWENGFRSIEYRVSDSVRLSEAEEPEAVETLAAAPNLSKLTLEAEPIETTETTNTTPLSTYIPDELVGAVAEIAEEVTE